MCKILENIFEKVMKLVIFYTTSLWQKGIQIQLAQLGKWVLQEKIHKNYPVFVISILKLDISFFLMLWDVSVD